MNSSIVEHLRVRVPRRPLQKVKPATCYKTWLTEIEYTIPLDIPIAPCSSFRGRNDVLERMQIHFYEAGTKDNKRRTFAICGLGMLFLQLPF